MRVTLAKLSAPKLVRPLERERLYRALDEACERQVVWVAAPAGSGKTTLAASYSSSRRLPGLWIRVDEDDSDPATFFHFLGELSRRVSRRRTRGLPRLTPELVPSMRAFARNFARQMFAHLPDAAVLVLDDYQEISAESAVHELLAIVLHEAPREFRLLVLSRAEPPSVLAQLAGYERLATIDAETLRLTEGEARAFAALHGKRRDSAQVRARWERSQGWIAGFILLNEHGSAMANDGAADPATQPRLFDYFAAQVLQKLSEDERQFLLRSALLGNMTVQMAAELTESPRAGQMLADLARRNYFTVRHSERAGGYRYHPLFREFLLSTAERVLDPRTFLALQERTARILEEAGESERAAETYSALRDWESLTRVLHELAPAMLAQGRSRILLAWLRPLSEQALTATPWLLYWRAAALFMPEPRRAVSEFGQAWERFLANGDMTGACFAWTSTVEALLFLHEFHLLERWVVDHRKIASGILEYLPPVLQVRFVAALFQAMYVACPEDSEIGLWERRAIAMLDWEVPSDALLMLGVTLLLRSTYYGPGRTGTARILSRVGPAAAATDASPLFAYAWYALVPQYYYWYDEDPGYRAMHAEIGAWESMAQRHEFHPMRHVGYLHTLLIALADGKLETAATNLTALDGMGHLSKQERSFHEWLRAWYWYASGNFGAMNRHAEASVGLATECRLETTIAPTLAMLGMARAMEGTLRQGLPLLGRARRMARRCGLGWVECLSLLWCAAIAIRRRQGPRAIRFLRPGLAIAARARFMRLSGVLRTDLAQLAAVALEHGVESDYVRALIRCRHLSAPRSAGAQAWPWPIAIRSMGAFEIMHDDKPIRFGRKAPKKPLVLLKALLALGGYVGEPRICALLWPGVDARSARGALATAIHRLRAIIGVKAVASGEQRVGLDRERIFVDAWRFEDLTRDAERTAQPDQRDALLAQAADLYQGEFLAGEEQPWAVSARERLRARFLRAVDELGRSHAARGDWRAALRWYQRGLDTDELIEEFHQGLIDAYAALGYRGEAIAAYRRCQRTLSKMLGVAPSPALQARYRALLDA